VSGASRHASPLAVRRIALIAILLVLLSWNASLIAAPIVSRAVDGGPTASALLYAAASLVCHQRPERSFHVSGAKLPVCARCLGLYLGASAGVVGWMLIAGLGRRAAPRSTRWSSQVRTIVTLAAIPTLASVGTAWVGVWDPGNVIRALLALPLGAAAGGVVAAVAARDLE
jgi:uncharacterized membrane protein